MQHKFVIDWSGHELKSKSDFKFYELLCVFSKYPVINYNFWKKTEPLTLGFFIFILFQFEISSGILSTTEAVIVKAILTSLLKSFQFLFCYWEHILTIKNIWIVFLRFEDNKRSRNVCMYVCMNVVYLQRGKQFVFKANLVADQYLCLSSEW